MNTNTNIIAALRAAAQCKTPVEGAQVYARAGIPVFPVSAEKVPFTQHGFKDAYTDETKIQITWDAWDASSQPLIGIPTGRGTGVVVIDVDKKGGVDGEKELSLICNIKEWERSVPTVLTPSGGKHFYFAAPVDKLKSTAKVLAPGVDTRGDGGAIIAPPSRMPAGVYTLVNCPTSLPPLPPDLEVALRNAGILGDAPKIVGPKPNPNPGAPKQGQRFEIQTALAVLDPDISYDQWLQIGMALHDYDPDTGLELWDAWSQRGNRYKPGEPASKWTGFGNNGPHTPRITLRTLFARARANGWTPPHSLATDDPIAQAYGAAIICISDKRCSPNHEHIAAYYLRKTGAIYDGASGDYYRYEPETGLWKPVPQAAHMAELSRVFREVLVENGGEDLLGTRTHRTLQQISRMAANLANIENAFEHESDLIHVANGMLEIREDGTVALIPFSPDCFSRNRCPIPWDPNAQCPEFLAAIGQVLPPDDVQTLQLFFGQCLLGKNLTQVFLILRGPAGLMKSTLQQILILLVGIENVESLRPSHLGGRFELARFVGKQLLVAADVSSDFLATSAAHILKSLTGGDTLTAERKGSNESISIRGDFNICVTSNADLKVHLEGDRGAYERRILVLDFRGNKPAEAIPDFAAHIIAKEGPGILRWAVEGAVALLQAVKATGRFPRSPAHLARIEDFLDQSDSAAVFVSTCVQKAPGADVSTKELYAAYEDFCGLKGWASLSEREFQLKLPHLMKTLHGVVGSHSLVREFKPARGYRGVSLVEGMKGPADPGTGAEV